MNDRRPYKKRRHRWKGSLPTVGVGAVTSIFWIAVSATTIFSQLPESVPAGGVCGGTGTPVQTVYTERQGRPGKPPPRDRLTGASPLRGSSLSRIAAQRAPDATAAPLSRHSAVSAVSVPGESNSPAVIGPSIKDKSPGHHSPRSGPLSDVGRPPEGMFPLSWPRVTWPLSLFETQQGNDRAVSVEPSLLPDPLDNGVIVQEGPLTISSSVGGWAVVDAVWVEAEFVLWKHRGHRLPALVTTDPNDGVLPGATILFGNDRVGQMPRPGGRLRVGAWSDETQYFGWEAGLTVLGEAQVRFQADSNEFPLLARPFFNFTDNLQGGFVGQDALLVAEPGFSTGSIVVHTGSDVLSGDITCRRVFRLDGQWRVDLLAGYLTGRIDEALRVTSFTDITGQDTQITVEDFFATKNTFHGGHLGLELQRRLPHGATFGVLTRVGFGNMRQSVTIAGRQETISGGQSTTDQAGLLAQSTNIGLHHRDVFAVAPEITVRYTLPLTDNLHFLAGYSFLYWNRVARPAEQLDPQLGVNPNQPPPPGEPQRPMLQFRDGDFYVHGADLGLQWSY